MNFAFEIRRESNPRCYLTRSSTHHMWWEPAVPIVYTRSAEWLRSKTLWDSSAGSIPSVSQMQNSSTSITQWLGSTPQRYDVKQLEHVVFICMYLYMCIVTYIHINTEIQTHTWIHTQMSVWIYIYRYIHRSVCVHMSKYTRWECDKYERLPDNMVVHVELGSYAIVNHIHTHTHTHTTNTYMFESRYCSGKWVHTTLWGSIGVGSSPVLINKHDHCI